MRVLEDVRFKIKHANKECKLNLELIPDRCADDHSVWVIRPKGEVVGGLIVAHLDDLFTPEDVMVLVEMLTPKFFAEMQRLQFLTAESWCYLDGVLYLGMELIQIMGNQVVGGHWSHELQSMLTVV